MTQSFSDFAALHDKFRYSYFDEDGNLKQKKLGTYWLNYPSRRQYTAGMAFMPQHNEQVVNGRLNLWQGYGVNAVKPAGKSGAAGASKFLAFALDVICSGNEEHFDYLIKREAFILQRRPRSEIALGLSTKEEGVGKGFYEQVMRRLLGNHAMQVGRPEHVIGKFNPHLETLLRLTADEALFVGDPRHRNALYGQITEKENTIEPKFCGVYSAANYLNISITTNAPHFLVVGEDARRLFVPTVSPVHKQDFDYFGAIFDQLKNDGGFEALLYHLLNEIDLRDFEVSKVPRTAGLLEQISYSRRGVDGLVEAVCNTARVPNEHPSWLGFTVTSGSEEGHGFEVALSKSKDPDLARLSTLTVSKRLCRDWGCKAEQRREAGGNSGLQWPPLAELRQRFIDKFGPQEWQIADQTEWQADDTVESKVAPAKVEPKKTRRRIHG